MEIRCTLEKNLPWHSFVQNQTSWSFLPSSYERTLTRQNRHLQKCWEIRCHRCQNFLKIYDFRQFLLIFDIISKMVDHWLMFRMIWIGCHQHIIGVERGWLLIKTKGKRDFLKKKCQNILIAVHFYLVFSPELKAGARFCESQLGLKWVAIVRQ